LKSKRVLRERSLDTRAVYAPDMWPIMGLKSAVMVVGGSERAKEEGREVEEDDDDDNDGCAADSCSGGGRVGVVIMSGKVVNRIPVDTAERT
jgi:hypothetical protein